MMLSERRMAENMALAAHPIPSSPSSPIACPLDPETASTALVTSSRPPPSLRGKTDITSSTTSAWALSLRKMPTTATRKMSRGKIEKRT